MSISSPRHPLRFLPHTTRSVAGVAIGFVLALSMLNLLGWLLNVSLLKSVSPHWVPMKVITALCFIFSAAALALILSARIGDEQEAGEPGGKAERAGTRLLVARILASVVILLGVVSALNYAVRLAAGVEDPMQGVPFLHVFLSTDTRMAFLTSALFVVLGIATLLLAERSGRAAGVAHAIIFPAAIASYFVPASYLLGVQSLHDWLGTPVALNTGLAFCALSAAGFLTRRDTWLMKVFTGDHGGSVMARRLLPGLLVLPLIIAWLRLSGERSGLFKSEVGVALVALAYTVCFVWLAWFAARATNRTDEQRREAERAVAESERALRRLNAELEQRVRDATAEVRRANEALEQRVAERAGELQKANEFLLASRRAALNLTEDAVAARKDAEQAARRIASISRHYQALSRVNEAIVRASDPAALLHTACEIISESGDYRLAWVGLTDGPGTGGGHAVRSLAACGPAVDYLHQVRIETEGALGTGPTGTAIRENRPVVNADFDSNPLTAPWRETARKHGFRSSAAFPLTRRGKAVGALTLYAGEPKAFDDERVKLLESLAADLSYALQSLEAERLRREAEERAADARRQLAESVQELARQNVELRSTEENLRATSEYLEKLMANANAPIIVWDPQFRITRFNRAFEHLTGRRAQDVVGKDIELLFPPNRRQELMALLRRASSGERWVVVEIPIQHVAGEVRTVLWNSALLFDSDGKTPVATIAQGQDITERVRAEQALAQNEDEYRRLAQMLAHSIKSPLSTVRLLAQGLDPAADSARDVILEQVERLNQIALSLMYMSDSRTRQRISVDLDRLVERSVVEQDLTLQAGVKVELKLVRSLPPVKANEEQMVRALGNLIDNAVEAMEGKGTLTLATRAEGNASVIIEVADTGPGIPAAFREKLFQPFLTRKPGGTGLGLPIVKRIVEDHGGKVELVSKPDEGARFRITLPAETKE
jgi:PAS domain S-box-containing protein